MVLRVAFSPDSLALASAAADGLLTLWDPETGKSTLHLAGHTGAVASASWSPDGKQLASAGFDHTVNVWDAKTGRLVWSLSGHTAEVLGVAYSPNGQQVASAGNDRTVRTWNVVSGQLLHTLELPDIGNSVTYSPDGRYLAAAIGDPVELHAPGALYFWDARTGTPVAIFHWTREILFNLAYSPDGQYLGAAAADGTAGIWRGKDLVGARAAP